MYILQFPNHFFKIGESGGHQTLEAKQTEITETKASETAKKSLGKRLSELRTNITKKLLKPTKSVGHVEKSFTMEDLENHKTIGERVKGASNYIKSKLQFKPKVNAEQISGVEENEYSEMRPENKNLKDKIKALSEKLKIPKSKQEAISVIQNTIENFGELSTKDKLKVIGLGLAAIGFSAAAIHAAAPIIASTAGGFAGTNFGTFAGLGMEKAVLGFGAIEGVKSVAFGTAAAMAKVYAGGIAAGSLGGALLATGKIREKLSTKKETINQATGFYLDKNQNVSENLNNLKDNLVYIKNNSDFNEEQKLQARKDLINDAINAKIEQQFPNNKDENLTKALDKAVENDDYNLWLKIQLGNADKNKINLDLLNLSKIDFLHAQESKYREQVGYKVKIVNFDELNIDQINSAKQIIRVSEKNETSFVFDKCPPRTELLIDSQKFLISDIFASEGRHSIAVLWTDRKGELMPRLAYKSNSDGTWRMDMKGDVKFNKGLHYTASSKLCHELVETLDYKCKQQNLTKEEYNEINPKHRNYDQKDIEDENLQALIGNLISHKTMLEQNMRSILQPNPDEVRDKIVKLGSFQHGQKSYDYSVYEKLIATIDHKLVPDFSNPAVDNYQFNHSIIGECTVSKYIHEIDGVKYEYDIANPKDGSLPFVHSITEMNSPIMSVGIYEKLAEFGFLQLKPIEYDSQIPNTFGDKNGITAPISGNAKNCSHYRDIRPFLAKNPIIANYICKDSPVTL
jgi:hypothetical protein